MKLNLIPLVAASGLLLGGCASAPVDPAAVTVDREVLTGSRIAQEVPRDEDGNMKLQPGLRIYTAEDIDRTGAGSTDEALRKLTPIVR
jgi:hypothetical protein